MADLDLDSAAPAPAPEELQGLQGSDRIARLLMAEMGGEMAGAYARTRELQERWARELHPEEGLRERKKRLTRQQISDVATTLFLVRGFEHVTVAQIAEIVGVSEKTVYNYFPTKESLVFDEADEGQARLARALREREPNESPTRAMLRALEQDAKRLEELPDESHMLLPLFLEMIETTPALRAAWLELQDRLVEVATVELARHAELDPREPEPAIAARAIVGLTDVVMRSHVRHIEDGLRGRALSKAVTSDLERSARLLDTGLWSFSLLTQGTRTRSQLRDAALATEDARKQVMDALEQARSTWNELRGRAQGHTRQTYEDTKHHAKTRATATREEAKRAAKAQAAAIREEAKRTAKAHAMRLGEEVKRAAFDQIASSRTEHERGAYERFRREMGERHTAIRERQQRLADQRQQAEQGAAGEH